MNAILGTILAAAAAQAADPVELTAKDIVHWINAHSKRRISAPDHLGLVNKRLTLPRAALDEARAYEAGTRLLRTLDVAVVQADAAGLQEAVEGAIASKKPLAVHADVASLPASDEFCTLVLTFKHCSPRDVQAAFINVISYPQNCLSVETSQRLVLSDYASNLRRLAEIAKGMDVPRASRAWRVSLVLLEASKGEPLAPPAELDGLELPKAAAADRFVRLGDFALRVAVPQNERPPLRNAPVEATLRTAEPKPLVVELAGASGDETALRLESLSVATSENPAPLLKSKVELPDGRWVLVAVAPHGAGRLVLAARAVREAP